MRNHRSPGAGWRTLGMLAAGVAGIGGVAAALAKLTASRRALATEHTTLGSIPITVRTPKPETSTPQGNSTTPRSPVVIIAHGFAASKQIMDAFAVTLARNGYRALTFDFPGHGRNATPLSGTMEEYEHRARLLGDALERVVAFAQQRFQHPIALIGHSMGSAVVAQYAQEHPETPAVVGVSLVYNQTTPTTPRNLLVINGGLEKQLLSMAKQVIDQVAGDGSGQIGVTYGDITAGTARRLALAPGSEHIGVLFNPATLKETLEWLDQSFNRTPPPQPYLDHRLPWLGVLYLSVSLLFWPLARLLRRLPAATPDALHLAGHEGHDGQRPPRYTSAEWNTLVWAPALLTPVLMRLLPGERLLPLLIGGSLAAHFAIYGALTSAGLMLHRQQNRAPGASGSAPHRTPLQTVQITVPAALFMAGYVALAFGLPTQHFVLNIFPPRQRATIAAAAFAAMLPYFLADELLTRQPGVPKGAYPLTKVSFMLSLALAIALNPRKLFFLILIAPIFTAYFALYGSFSGLLYRHTGTPLPGAIANAAIFSWTTAAIFPQVEQ